MNSNVNLNQIIESDYELTQYLFDGCKPSENWKIGTEHEKFCFSNKDLKPLKYNGKQSIKRILELIRDDFGWQEIVEDSYIIGLEKDGAKITLEPGGQLELSGAILNNLHETSDEVKNHLKDLKNVSKKLDVSFIGIGAAPIWTQEEMPVMPKGRYKLMTPYMDKVGKCGKKMMYSTCTIQVNLDFSSEKDMRKKVQVGFALQPIITALFSSSPFYNGKYTGFQSWRANIWHYTDASRTGIVPIIFNKNFGFEDWTNYALDVPMYFVCRKGTYINALGQSFRKFLKGDLEALPGEKPTLQDWHDHLTTVFSEVRLKQFIEMRGADSGPSDKICPLSAFWVGICYDQDSLDEAWSICKNWSFEKIRDLSIEVAKNGLHSKIDNISLFSFAEKLLSISEEGLKRRGIFKKSDDLNMIDESFYLHGLKEIIYSKKSLSDLLVKKYYGSWKKDLKNIYKDFIF